MSFLRRWWPVGAALGCPLLLLGLLRGVSSLDMRWMSANGHVAIMGAVSGLALVVAAVSSRAALQCGEPGVVWMAAGCANVGILLLGHGLTTPGALFQPVNQWVGRLPYGAMAAIALCLFMAGRSPQRRPSTWVSRHPGPALALLTIPVSIAVAVLVNDPLSFAGDRRLPGETGVRWVVSGVIVGLLLAVIVVHWRRWHLGHDPIQMALVLSSAACIASVFSFQLGNYTHMSWWNYHGYLLAGFGGTIYAIVRRGRQRATVADVLTATFADDPFDHIVEGYPEALLTLVRAVEIKDAYTHGHSERTAKVAVELAVRMGLPPERLRTIACGAFLHDLGKIAIPDEILNKPGKLDDAEFAVMQTHPRLGYELASSAASLSDALPIILHHHERLDGAGYPERLGGTDIPLDARIVTVADVWDALTSDRAYRAGWEPERALAHIKAGSGTHFDPVVVNAFVALAADWGVSLPAEPGEAAVAWTAAQTCHEVDPATPEPELVEVG